MTLELTDTPNVERAEMMLRNWGTKMITTVEENKYPIATTKSSSRGNRLRYDWGPSNVMGEHTSGLAPRRIRGSHPGRGLYQCRNQGSSRRRDSQVRRRRDMRGGSRSRLGHGQPVSHGHGQQRQKPDAATHALQLLCGAISKPSPHCTQRSSSREFISGAMVVTANGPFFYRSTH